MYVQQAALRVSFSEDLVDHVFNGNSNLEFLSVTCVQQIALYETI